jgi:membrane-bound lytic murein transglycosylase D
MKNNYKTLIPFIFFILFAQASFAQIPQVPAELQFADLIVRINPQARREIQLDVDAQYRNPTYLQVKKRRVALYMPVIEQVLRDAGVPEDLKYLVIQESGLIADAVSTSNAVGFWQFKQGTAEEVFLRVDNQVDERKNIVSSTRGAALYLQKNNASFDNWMCAMVSYQMGLGGAKAYFGNSYNGKRVIDIDRNSHWYFKKYLAHKIAFENQLGMMVSNERLVEVEIQGPTTLKVLAKKYGVAEEHLEEYNKWAHNGKIPGDRTYPLVYLNSGSLPVRTAIITETIPENNSTTSIPSNQRAYRQADSYPKVGGNTTKANLPDQITVNALTGVQAAQTTTLSKLSDRVGVRESKLRRLNDLEKGERIEAGEYYYTEKKNGKAEVATHIVRPGETLWSISQKYGLKLSSLKAKNRIREDRDLKSGMVLNLQEHRKRGEEIPVVKVTPSPPSRVAVTTVQPPPTSPSKETYQPTHSTEPSKTYHTVSSGETLFAISKKYGVSVDQLKKWNSIGSQNIISVGQKLVIFNP